MKIKQFDQQQVFQDFLAHDTDFREHTAFEAALMSRRTQETQFLLDGYCKVCDIPTTFLVDRLFGAQETASGWLPNWRERLVCSHCQLNNRQRAVLHMIKAAIAKRHPEESQPLSLYAMEQISPLFHWIKHHLPHITSTGSEYLGADLKGGSIVNEIRHEDIEALSFIDQQFDFITSNDVLEHVNHPQRAFAEMYRVLKWGGEIFVTVPFHINATHTIRRAEQLENQVKHLLPPQYHGNPLSEAGSLVFHDFGWNFVSQLKEVGFQTVYLCHYWSYWYGYLGEPQYYFWAQKPMKN